LTKEKKFNESVGLIDQLDYLNNNDILVGGRWYYCKKLHRTLRDRCIGFFLRAKKIVNYLIKWSMMK